MSDLREAQKLRLGELMTPLLAFTRNDPAKFLKLLVPPAPPLRRWQADVCRQISTQLDSGRKRIRVLVRSCHGAGKTFLAALLTLWWTARTEEARGVTTAPSWTGVETLLWPEIRRLYRDSILKRADLGECLMTDLRFAPEWFTIGLSSDHPVNLEGHHSRTSALRVIDEAKGVAPMIFEATEGLLDAPEILDLWISTPSVAHGDFYERDITLRRPTDQIIRRVVTIDELVAEGIPGKKEWRDEHLEAWGLESDEYQSRALARYLTSSERNLFPPAWIEKMLGASLEVRTKTIGALDVAGSIAGDQNALVLGRGFDREGRLQVDAMHTWREPSTSRTRERALTILNEGAAGQDRPIVIDAAGIGKGVYDVLQERRYEAVAWVSQTRANDPTRYVNRKSEVAFLARELLEAGKIGFPPKSPILEMFMTQAAGMRFKITNQGKRQVIDPDDSPDLVDAFLMFVHGATIGLGRGIMGQVEAVRPMAAASSAGIRRTRPDAA